MSGAKPNAAAAEQMIALVEEVRKEQDSIGGVCELVAVGGPPDGGPLPASCAGREGVRLLEGAGRGAAERG